ncbi:MAG: methyltransferase domain-containing protein [Polyangiaceae bacterium]|nr:methyltransferase domain-containing protein [Polyangiaceae bacterium]
MPSYEAFSRVYDLPLERLYRSARRAAAEALELREGHRVLDVPCGTGQSFDALVERVGSGGDVVGLDLSPGMLREARARVASRGWRHVEPREADALTVTDEELPGASFDRLHVFLGMSVFPEPAATFARLWRALRPGGRCVVVDVHAARPGVQGRLVNFVARADVRRRSWEALEAVACGFERRALSSSWVHGGELFLASGDKPA